MPHQQGMASAPRIDLAKAKELFDAGEAVFVDVRSEEAYRKAHIPAAVSMALRDLPRRCGELSTGGKLIFYCA